MYASATRWIAGVSFRCKAVSPRAVHRPMIAGSRAALALLGTAFWCVSPASLATSLPPADYVINHQSTVDSPGGVVAEGPLPADGVATYSTSYIGAGFQEVGSALVTGKSSPRVDIQSDLTYAGSSVGSGFSSNLSAWVSYRAAVVLTADLPPGVTVDTIPILFQAAGHASASTTIGGDLADAHAQVRSNALGINLNAYAAGSTQEFQYFSTAWFNPVNFQFIDILVEVDGFALIGDTSQPSSAQFQAIADPVLTIDPSWLYSRYYTLVVSPNVGNSDPTAVPEPGTLALFGLCLAGLGMTRRRKA